MSSTHVHRPPERLEPAQDDQDQAPSVPQRKGGVNEQFVGDRLLTTGFRGFDGIVDLGDGGADEEGEDESGDVPYKVKVILGAREDEFR